MSKEELSVHNTKGLPIVTLDRFEKSNYQCLGVCKVKKSGKEFFNSVSIERGDNNNQARISCIPVGVYPLVLEYSPRFDKMLWEIKEVPNRSECKFHSANFSRQLNGCVALGKQTIDIDGDGNKDVTSSRDTMKEFHDSLDGYTEAILIVRDNMV